MGCQRKEMQPFQPALSLTILLFYQHTKSIHKATDQVIVSENMQLIPLGAWSSTLLKFPLKHNTEASTSSCSALPYRAGSEAPQTGCPEQLTDPAEQRIIIQAEVTLGDEPVYALLFKVCEF